MSMAEIDFLLDKMYEINKYLGGKAFEADFRDKSGGVFRGLRADFHKKFEETKKIQNKRNDELRTTDRSIEILFLNNRIKTGIEFMETVVEKMHQTLSTYKESQELMKEARDITHDCSELLEKMKEIEKFHLAITAKKDEKIKNAREMNLKFQNRLIDQEVENLIFEEESAPASKGRRGPKKKKIDLKAMNANAEALKNMPLTPEEKMALDRWKRIDAEIDGNLDEIYVQMEKLNTQLDSFDENMRKNEVLVEYVTEQAFKLSSDLQTTNAKLKIILDKFNSPGKLCIELTMATLISILVGMLVYLVRRYMAVSSGSA